MDVSNKWRERVELERKKVIECINWREINFPKIEMCHHSWDKLKRKVCLGLGRYGNVVSYIVPKIPV